MCVFVFICPDMPAWKLWWDSARHFFLLGSFVDLGMCVCVLPSSCALPCYLPGEIIFLPSLLICGVPPSPLCPPGGSDQWKDLMMSTFGTVVDWLAYPSPTCNFLHFPSSRWSGWCPDWAWDLDSGREVLLLFCSLLLSLLHLIVIFVHAAQLQSQMEDW